MTTKHEWKVGDRAFYPDDGMWIEITKILDEGMLEGSPTVWVETRPRPVATYDPEELEPAATDYPTEPTTVTDIGPARLGPAGPRPNPFTSYGERFGHLAEPLEPLKIRMTGATADRLSGLVKPDEIVVVWAESVAGVPVVVAETPDGDRYLLSDGGSIAIGVAAN